jgi:hypothetical protein
MAANILLRDSTACAKQGHLVYQEVFGSLIPFQAKMIPVHSGIADGLPSLFQPQKITVIQNLNDLFS